MGYLGTKPANQITDSTLIADGTITTSDLASGLTVNFADGSASTPSITNDGDTNTGIFFPAADTIAFAEGGAEVARFDSSGRLILGSTTADGRLKVVETATGAGVTFYSSNDNSAGQIGTTNESGLSNGININAYRGDGKVVISTNNTERMRIDSSGNLLVGTTLTGGRQMIAFDNAGQSGTRYLHSSTTYNGEVLVFVRANNTTKMGAVYCDGANTSYQTSSDYRLKENIQPMLGGLNKVMQLKPCTYKWKDMDKNGQGFIAHELQEVVPDAVVGEKDAVNEDGSIKAQGIDTSFLVATLTAAIQEQQAIITEQSLALQDLKARIETLENK